MITGMTALPASTKRFSLRVCGGFAILLSAGIAGAFGPQFPLLNALPGVVGWLVGKWLAIPVDDVIKLALQLMAPDQAASVAVSTLQALPPEKAEAATALLIASLPPEAAQRASLKPSSPSIPTTIQFIGESEPPPNPLSDTPRSSR